MDDRNAAKCYLEARPEIKYFWKPYKQKFDERRKTMCTSNNDSVEVAYHEAGHMVVAYVLGGDLISVSMSPRQSIYTLNNSDCMGKATAFMAGGEAEELVPNYVPRDILARTNDDWEKAKKVAEESGLTGNEEIGDFIEEAINRAQAIISQKRSAVEALSRELINRNKLRGPEVIALIKPHITDTGPT